MVRASKTVKQSTASNTTTVSTPVAETATEVPKKTSTKKSSAKSAVPAVDTTVPAVETAAALTNEVVVDSDASSVAQKMNEFGAKLQQLNSIFSSVKGDFKTLEKVITRELKAALKSSSKKKKRSGNRTPSGFVKPTLISDELATFLGKEPGCEMARTAVSKEINAYIRANQLQDPENGRKINPDNKLRSLLKINGSDELTYFNLQRFMKHHFIKTEVVATA